VKPAFLTCFLMLACEDSAPGFRGGVQEEPIPCYTDADGDGFGDEADMVQEVDCPSGYVELAGDCDDAEAAVYPAAAEVCDELDNDCDGETDEGLLQTWYLDWDWDGYGDAASPYEACELPVGYSADATDCDDDDNDTYPGAEELCDGLDNDCDGEIDEELETTTSYVDADGDGYGDPQSAESTCEGVDDRVSNGEDCDDSSADVYPGAPDVCDGLPNSCEKDWENDDGLVTFWNGVGEPTDLTELFAAGSLKRLARYTINARGTLRFCDGTYYATIDVRAPNVTVGSLNGAETTTLDGGGVRQLFVNRDGQGVFHLGGLTIANGLGRFGGGVFSEGDIEVSDCVLRDNLAREEGGALFLNDGSITVLDSVISGNEAEEGAVAMAVGDIVVDGCSFTGNLASLEGGAIALDDGTLQVTDSIFDGNQSGDKGGAVHVYQTNVEIDGSDFIDNHSNNGGALFMNNGAVQVVDSLFFRNTVHGRGGGIYIQNGDGDVTDSLFSDNRSQNSWGGGVLIVSGSLRCVRSKKSSSAGFQGNIATEGGAVLASDTVSSVDCDWGEGTTDNLVEDISLPGNVANYGNNASFTCTEKGCW